MQALRQGLARRRAEWQDAVRACRSEIWWSSSHWACVRMLIGGICVAAALATFYMLLTQRMPGPEDFFARESYQVLAGMTDRSVVVFLGHIVHYGLLLVPLMYLFLGWLVVTFPYRR